MTVTVAQIWRHPIKAHGRESLQSVTLVAGQTMPWDRTWAVAHENTKARDGSWIHCANFSRAAKSPSLQAMSCTLDETTGQVTLTHPELAPITIDPDKDEAKFLAWVAPVMPQDRPASSRIIRATERGMTDTNFASISLNNLASCSAVAEILDLPVTSERWRGNIWFDGLEAWEETQWIGKSLRIGAAVLDVQEPIGRCLATAVDPETGHRNADTLAALKACGQGTNFGVYATVRTGGAVAVGDTVDLLP